MIWYELPNWSMYMDISNRPGLMFIKQALAIETLLSNEALDGVHLVCDFKILS